MSDTAAYTGRDRRRASRCAVAGGVAVRRAGHHRIAGTLQDLTQDGCRIVTALCAREGEHVWVRIPGLESLSGTVRWQGGDAIGLAFHNPLHIAVADRICGLAPLRLASRPSGARTARGSGSRRDRILSGDPGSGSPLPERRYQAEHGNAQQSVFFQQPAPQYDTRGELRRPAETFGLLTLRVEGRKLLVGDLSASGVGVVGVIPLEAGDPVEVEIEGHAPVLGAIAWRRPNSFGISLPPLSLDLYPRGND